ncbi:hypothetical protein DM02DRAFT_686612 [Periconia macrospinosa]|uniref:Rhodopsin domain-containing protein n=1 Tax=Periconia macrospinosa TaxID=97972 RepID=A0A2V1DG09_9PLEO|nr:hypothetical protein DM02DRAFT_686612 [Periconia macrospinosa]
MSLSALSVLTFTLCGNLCSTLDFLCSFGMLDSKTYLIPSMQYLYVCSVLYGVIIMLLKTGILLEWVRIFVPHGHRNAFWWTCYATLGINILFYVTRTFVEIFGCTPRPKIWDAIVPGRCLDIAKVNIVTSCINFVSDLIILLLPQKVIWSLNTSTSRKLAIGTLFALGVFACAAAGVRLHSSTVFNSSPNVLYSAADMGLWCTAEMVCGFMVLCLPSTLKLVKESRWMRKLLSGFKSSSRSRSTDPPAISIRDRLSVPNRRRKQHTDASLFTDTDGADSLPLTNINTVSELSVYTVSAGTNQGNDGSFDKSLIGR